MKPNDRNMNERQAFDGLLASDRFDDSVNEQHRDELRAKLLQAFDAPASDTAVVEPHRGGIKEHASASRNRSFGWALSIALCLMGLVAVWIFSDGGTNDPQRPTPEVRLDPELVASLDEVIEFRGDVPPAALFNAIAMCQLDYEGRERFDSLQP